MPERIMMKGNYAVVEAAINAGCRYFFGYPITPQNEIPEAMSSRMPEVGGVYLQAESECAAINMVFGASAVGARVMTSSSGPGISLMQEGISYICGAELPCVIVDIVRGGPGLGNIAPAQSDYFQATRGGGHGDYYCLVLAPWSVQELYDHTLMAFDLADRYRIPAIVLADAVIGQMLEPLELHQCDESQAVQKPWAIGGCGNRKPNIVNSLYIDPDDLEEVNLRIRRRFEEARREQIRWEEFRTEDAEILLVAYGTAARVCKTAVDLAREKGIAAGLLRPITLAPFPLGRIHDAAAGVAQVLVVEMSLGQMLEDVQRAVSGVADVDFLGRTGGNIPYPGDVLERVVNLAGNAAKSSARAAHEVVTE